MEDVILIFWLLLPSSTEIWSLYFSRALKKSVPKASITFVRRWWLFWIGYFKHYFTMKCLFSYSPHLQMLSTTTTMQCAICVSCMLSIPISAPSPIWELFGIVLFSLPRSSLNLLSLELTPVYVRIVVMVYHVVSQGTYLPFLLHNLDFLFWGH